MDAQAVTWEPNASAAVAGSAHDFFDRPAPPGYLDEWYQRLAQADRESARGVATVVIFRLHDEHLALPISRLVEVTAPQPVHAVPHRTNRVLQGLVNIRGQLRLCVSLHGLLGIERPSTPEAHDEKKSRLVVVQQRSEAWVFAVEEVVAVGRIDVDARRPVPATLGRGSSVSGSIFEWHGHTVALLDGERLFPMLRSACS